MLLPVPQFDRLPGTYVGAGAWMDIADESKRYRVHQTIAMASNALVIEYTHDFQEEGTSTSGAFIFQREGGNLLHVLMADKPLGNGYMFGDYLHYYLKVGEIFVQASYQVTAAGLQVNGSSSSNKQGRFIAWREELRKKIDG